MNLFASDDDVRAAQRRVAGGKDFRNVQLTPAESRREHIENEREVRQHARSRHFAFLLFVLPVLIVLVGQLVEFLVGWILTRNSIP